MDFTIPTDCESADSPRLCKIRRKLLRLAFFSDLHGVRITLAIAEFVWAITLFWPGDTFSRPTYKLMADFLPLENVWAVIWLASAVIQTAIVLTGEYHTKSATIFAGFNSILWWFVTLSMYNSVTPPPAAISGELALSIGAAWVFVRSGWVPLGARRATRYANES